MSPSPPDPRTLVFADLEHELDNTRRALAAIPDEHLDWSPHEKSWSLGALGTHIANLLLWQQMALEEDGYDLATSGPKLEAPATTAAILARFDENRESLQRALDAAESSALGEPWTLRKGEHEVFTLPRHHVLRTMGVSHMAHHRGQLTVYLRLLDVPVPGMYGPSADEQAGT